MSFNIRHIDEALLQSAYINYGMSNIHIIMRADAIIAGDKFSEEFNKLYILYRKDKNEQNIIEYLDGTRIIS